MSRLGEERRWRSRRSAPTSAATATRTGRRTQPTPTTTHDFLPDSIETVARTNPCVADSDGDKLLDGWEYLSALDLNDNALPYPGKRPYPNALFADAGVDHDGDGLHAWIEHTLWWAGGHKYPLDYSDGDQMTAPTTGGCRDLERLGLRRHPLRRRARLRQGRAREHLRVLRRATSCRGSRPSPARSARTCMDPDTDGDGLLDGYDDQDHDDVSNIAELSAGTWAMNPCDPGISRTCPRWLEDSAHSEEAEDTCITRSVLSYEGIRIRTTSTRTRRTSRSGPDERLDPGSDGPTYCNTYPYIPLPEELLGLSKVRRSL